MNSQLSTHVLPDLDDMKEEEIPLNSLYWEAREGEIGDTKKGIILGFETRPYSRVNKDTGEIATVELEMVKFAAQMKNKQGVIYYETYTNGSTLLVDAIKNAVESGRIVCGSTPVKIEYTGTRKTKNGNFMDKFRVTVLSLVAA